MDPKQKTNSIEKRVTKAIVLELSLIFAFAVSIFLISAQYDIFEKIIRFLRLHEDWELDEIIVVSIFLLFAAVLFSIRRLHDVNKSNKVLLNLNNELNKALSEIKHLKGIIPICSSCKKIRDDKGYWHQVESYIRDHSEVDFSHGICPDCIKKLYPDFDGQKTNPANKANTADAKSRTAD
jgi:hypothetical protein